MDMQTTKAKGKFFTVVRDGAPVVHITRKYLTRRMAEAAAKCWWAFHGGEKIMSTYTLAKESDLYGRQLLGRVDSAGKHIPTEYASKADAWEAVKKTSFSDPVTVLEDGKPVATFTWLFKTPDEPVPGKPGYVRRVRDLGKWTSKGWKLTGVQAVGTGKDRFIRTVAA
jgi:hypothetical protein